MKSKFTYKAFLFPVLTIGLFLASLNIIISNYPIDFFRLRWIDYFMIILFSITFVWLVKFEILRKMLFFEINEADIKTKSFLTNKSINKFSDLVGFKTKVNVTRMGNFEETIIMGNNSKEIILSELFIANYKDLKIKIADKLKDNGGARKNAL